MKKITGYYRTGKYSTWERFSIEGDPGEDEIVDFCKENIETKDGKPVREVKDIKTQ